MPSKGYGQYCPVAKAAEILTERWTPLILRDLLAGSHRFNELRRGMPAISPTLLSERLQQLERAGLIRRSRPPGGGRWEYHLTEAGEACRPFIEVMAEWGRRWAVAQLSREELDPTLMMWVILRSVRSGVTPPEARVTILFHLPDAPKDRRYWWLVFDPPDVELCLTDPGFEVDLTWRGTSRALAAVLMGEITLEGAHGAGAVTLEGPPRIRRWVSTWLGLRPRAAEAAQARG